MKYVYVIEKAADGSYSAYVPDLPGCTTCGDSVEEVKRNMKGAVSLYIDSLRQHGEPVPAPTSSVDVIEPTSSEDAEFGQVGETLAGQVFPADNFADWEVEQGVKRHGG